MMLKQILKMAMKMAMGFSAFLMLSCEQGSSGGTASSSGEITLSANAAFAIAGLNTTDCAFNNSVLINGESVTAYQNSSVLYGETCTSEVRLCDNGLLSGTYNFSTCTVASAASCLFNGQTIPNGSSVQAYNISSVDLGSECIAEMRTCNNGVLSGSNQYASCNINLPSACLFNGQTVPNGQFINAYLTSTVAFGELCSVESRYCIDGALSGSNQYASCVVNQPASCLFNGQTVVHGQSVAAFLNSSVGFGETCSSQTRICNNGVLSGTNQYASCAVNQPASCLFNGQSLAHGASVTAYQSSSTTAGELCNAEERFCNNGELAGSYQYASCVMDQQASCLFNGQTIANGASVKAFGNSRVNFGDFCISQLRECQNGVLSGFGEFASCEVGSPASCLFNGQTIADGQTVVGYKNSSVGAGLQCLSEVKKCSNGMLTGSFEYSNCVIESNDTEHDNKEKYCKKQRVEKEHPKNIDDDDDDKDDRSGDNDNSSHRPVKNRSLSDNGLHLGWYKHKHKEHFDCGKHRGWYKEKKKRRKNCK